MSPEERYKIDAFSLGIQYYGAGRFAVVAGFQPVCGNLLHHAVEMFVKGCLAPKLGVPAVGAYLHNLKRLWAEFKVQFPDAPIGDFDSFIHELHRFERIRYPENAMKEGSLVLVAFEAVAPAAQLFGAPVPAYFLSVADVDRLISELFKAAQLKPQGFVTYLKQQHAEKYFLFRNDTPLLRGEP